MLSMSAQPDTDLVRAAQAGDVGRGDRRTYRPHSRIGAREPASRNAVAPRCSRMEGRMSEERLEALLSVYRYRGAMPDFRAVVPIRRRSTWPWLAAAAAVLVIIVAITLRPGPNEWRVTSGIPRSLRIGDVIDKPVRLRSREVG